MNSTKEKNRSERIEMNKQWAKIAIKMEAIDEFVIFPSLDSIKYVQNKEYEFGTLVMCSDKVFLIEISTIPRTEYVKEIQEKAIKFKKFYPEYNDKELIPIYGSIIFPENVIKYATKKGLYLMAYREWDYVDIINFNEINKKSTDHEQNKPKI